MIEPDYLRQIRTAYDTVAIDYARLLDGLLAESTFDRMMLSTLAELVTGPVADLGCGPGRITGYLHALGVPVAGYDLSPAMVAEARRRYPELAFQVADLRSVDIAPGSLAGLLCWYSLIHLPTELLPDTFSRLGRLLRPGGLALLAFQVGERRGEHRVRLEHGYGHPITLDAYRLAPDRIAAQLGNAGFRLKAQLIRRPEGEEKTEQAYLLAEWAGDRGS